jgi:hypothetical protein
MSNVKKAVSALLKGNQVTFYIIPLTENQTLAAQKWMPTGASGPNFLK